MILLISWVKSDIYNGNKVASEVFVLKAGWSTLRQLTCIEHAPTWEHTASAVQCRFGPSAPDAAPGWRVRRASKAEQISCPQEEVLRRLQRETTCSSCCSALRVMIQRPIHQLTLLQSFVSRPHARRRYPEYRLRSLLRRRAAPPFLRKHASRVRDPASTD